MSIVEYKILDNQHYLDLGCTVVGMTTRRELLRCLTPVLLTPWVLDKAGKAEEIARVVEVKHLGRYLVFLNAAKMDVEQFCQAPLGVKHPLPPGTPVHPVYLRPGESMDDVVRIYELPDQT